MICRSRLVVFLFCASAFAAVGQRALAENTEQPVFLSARDLTPVRVDTRRASSVIATLGPGAVGLFRKTEDNRGCEAGWYSRVTGGVVCGKHLLRSDASAAAVSPADDPSAVDGLRSFWVPKFGPRVFESLASVNQGSALLRLRKGSVIRTTGGVFRRNGRPFIRNRKGMYVEAERLEELPAAARRLGLAIETPHRVPLGVVIAAGAVVHSAPAGEAQAIASVPQWTWIDAESTGPVQTASTENWQPLPLGGYLRSEQISLYRRPEMPLGLGDDERWIAVDLREQLAAAYEGKKVVRLMPCSTGHKGNTPVGEYRVQLKKRLHTMRLLMGQIRVEDVPWVMFFDRDEALAIHSAYWHSDFGQPRSHGCVNLPEDDAAWVYEWSWPRPSTEDSETMAVPPSAGSRVVIFHN